MVNKNKKKKKLICQMNSHGGSFFADVYGSTPKWPEIWCICMVERHFVLFFCFVPKHTYTKRAFSDLAYYPFSFNRWYICLLQNAI